MFPRNKEESPMTFTTPKTFYTQQLLLLILVRTLALKRNDCLKVFLDLFLTWFVLNDHVPIRLCAGDILGWLG